MTVPNQGNSSFEVAKSTLSHLLHEDSGQDLIEYALVAALVGLGAVTALKGLGTKISGAFNSVGSSLTSDV